MSQRTTIISHRHGVNVPDRIEVSLLPNGDFAIAVRDVAGASSALGFYTEADVRELIGVLTRMLGDDEIDWRQLPATGADDGA